jgi:hypothetical protein
MIKTNKQLKQQQKSPPPLHLVNIFRKEGTGAFST